MRCYILPGFALVTACLLGAETLQASPCHDPKRVVGGYTVDLQPLINWWSAQKGTRPLSGWKHVRGIIVRETASGWVMDGKAEGQGQHCTFLLKNPPQDRLRRFQELQRQLAENERGSEAAREYLSRPVVTDWYGTYVAQWQAPPISLKEYREASSLLGEFGRNINAIQAELASMQDAQGNFKLDAFALRVNETFEGVPVFDHGSTEGLCGHSSAPGAPN